MKVTHLFAVLVGLAAITLFAADASAFYNPSTGTFLQRDPGPGGASPVRIGAGGAAVAGGFMPRDQYADGMNLYQYVRSNPCGATDPDGLRSRVSVDEKNCKIVVTVNIGIYGKAASADLASRVKQTIEGEWNGHITTKGCDSGTSGYCNVEVVANVTYYPQAQHWPDVPEDNQIKFDGNTPRSYVETGLFGTNSHGHWEDSPQDARPDWSFAHEAGHLMGLPDDYQDRNGQSEPNPGHEGHMMARNGGFVTDHEIEGIIKNAKCPKSCCCKKPLLVASP